jgi:riboflavin kinase/FMN adenylyltransferase
MRLYRDFTNLDGGARSGVVVIGNFDGVHEGHRQVIARARAIADGLDAPLTVLTFEPHPRQYFQPDAPPFRLTPLRSKARQLEPLGIDALVALPFDERIASRTAGEFVDDILVASLQARHVVIGYDFAFGKGRGGNPQTLQEAGARHGFGVTCVEAALKADGTKFSSTEVRRLLRDGNPAAAAAYLGRPWEVEGHVQHGDKRGRQLGFPTANVDLEGYLLPAFGVYAVRLRLADPEDGEDARWIDGVANLGRRPTIGDDKVLLEVHLFGFTGDIYGRLVRVALVEFLRPEQKFDGLDALTAQIAADKERALAILAAA